MENLGKPMEENKIQDPSFLENQSLNSDLLAIQRQLPQQTLEQAIQFQDSNGGDGTNFTEAVP